MFMILSASFLATDVTDPTNTRIVEIPEGKHRVRRIENPLGLVGPWIVIDSDEPKFKDRVVGAAEEGWRDHENKHLHGAPRYRDHIVIQE
jgi:selenophosphate synthase